MVFTLRYMLGICLVLLASTQIQPSSVLARSVREVSESQVPSYDTQPVTIPQFSTEKTEDSTPNGEEITNPKTESSNTTLSSTENVTAENILSHDSREIVASQNNTSKQEADKIENESSPVVSVAEKITSINLDELKTTTQSVASQSKQDETVHQSTDNPQIINSSLNDLNTHESDVKEVTATVEHKHVTNSPIIGENKQQTRTDNARSLEFDISKYTSSEFHNKNNVYNVPTSPENEKFITPDFNHKSTTYKSPEPDFTYISEFTTPNNAYFDAKYDEVENKVKQELEDVGHYFEDHTAPNDKEVGLEELIEKSKRNNSDSRLDFLRYTSVASDNKEGKNSVNRNYESEHRLKINFDSIYNESKRIRDDEDTSSTTKATDFGSKILQTDENVVSTTTTRRNLPTKFSLVNRTKEQSSLLSNKIETESIKPLDLKLKEAKVAQDEKTSLNPIEDAEDFKKTREDNLINVSKRGSTKYVDTQYTTTESNEKKLDENPKINKIDAMLNYKLNESNQEEIKNNGSLQQNVEENNIYPVLVPAPQTTTSKNVESTTMKLYEMTEDDASEEEETSTTSNESTTSTTEETATEDLSDFSSEGTTTEEMYYEMTESTTATTTDADMEATALPLLVTDYSATVEMVTTDSTTEATTSEEPHTTEEIIVTTGETQSKETTKFARYDVVINDSTYSEIATTDYSTIVTTDTQTHQSVISEVLPNKTNELVTVKPIKVVNATDISLSNADIDDENDEFGEDEYIDFQHRKINHTQSGHDELDVISEPVEEIVTVKKHTTVTPVTEISVTPVVRVEEPTTEDEEEPLTEGSGLGSSDDESGDGTVIAIVISSVGVICLILLAGLLLFMRKRQKRFNYGQRCTPVSLDTYSMDNVSGYNSVRRKTTVRDSKRSYGNPAFDDASVSHPLNFQALVKFASNTDEISSEFSEIPLVTARTTELPDGCDVKNRYANIIPLPETRVILTSMEDDPTSDYINANYVTGPKGVRGYYIACQAPMLNTVNDFWRMIWEQQSKVILMFTHFYENGVEKCIDYLPPSEVLDCHRLFGDYQVTLKQREVKDKYIISSLQLKNMVSNSWREVTHFWYSGWPEKGVPSEENSLIAFLIEARSHVKLVQNHTEIKVNKMSNGLANGGASPVIVHCSPGTGRTGTVIACDIAIREFELKRIVDIPKIVYRVRRDRASSVQTKDQYAFIYKVINLYATKLTGGVLDSI